MCERLVVSSHAQSIHLYHPSGDITNGVETLSRFHIYATCPICCRDLKFDRSGVAKCCNKDFRLLILYHISMSESDPLELIPPEKIK